ncbi:hypothetical protein PI124_g16492 [Phytophthora idaei]|nr:hypothetical protein PI125_g16859 [Phytophthora idaei]KAG3140834.1 hypothetical protein PI126_g15790 [Phytophthora idaei]KAG3238544.1 hypothetical protein PI124_g16492 [Phytophthora idaei]
MLGVILISTNAMAYIYTGAVPGFDTTPVSTDTTRGPL